MRKSYIGFTAASVLAALTIACGSQEATVVDSFFRATQAKDTETVSSFSIVPFEGEVQSWKVTSVGEAQRSPAPLGSPILTRSALPDRILRKVSRRWRFNPSVSRRLEVSQS